MAKETDRQVFCPRDRCTGEEKFISVHPARKAIKIVILLIHLSYFKRLIYIFSVILGHKNHH
jgi:hypothetical protein